MVLSHFIREAYPNLILKGQVLPVGSDYWLLDLECKHCGKFTVKYLSHYEQMSEIARAIRPGLKSHLACGDARMPVLKYSIRKIVLE
jgi:hypothetical protein